MLSVIPDKWEYAISLSDGENPGHRDSGDFLSVGNIPVPLLFYSSAPPIQESNYRRLSSTNRARVYGI